VYVLTLCAFLGLAIAGLLAGVPIQYLTRDPAAIMGAPFYVGLFSNIGVLLWCASAAICFFSFLALKENINDREFSSFCLFSGFVTTLLLLDDFFLLHDSFFPKYLNIPEKLVYAGYSVIILPYLLKFRIIILKTEFLPLLFAFSFFGLSGAIDLLHHQFSSLQIGLQSLLEDGTKLLGVVSWCTYFARVCIRQIRYTILSQQANLNEIWDTRKIESKQHKLR
jgi:hypothetical protein